MFLESYLPQITTLLKSGATVASIRAFIEKIPVPDEAKEKLESHWVGLFESVSLGRDQAVRKKWAEEIAKKDIQAEREAILGQALAEIKQERDDAQSKSDIAPIRVQPLLFSEAAALAALKGFEISQLDAPFAQKLEDRTARLADRLGELGIGQDADEQQNWARAIATAEVEREKSDLEQKRGIEKSAGSVTMKLQPPTVENLPKVQPLLSAEAVALMAIDGVTLDSLDGPFEKKRGERKKRWAARLQELGLGKSDEERSNWASILASNEVSKERDELKGKNGDSPREVTEKAKLESQISEARNALRKSLVGMRQAFEKYREGVAEEGIGEKLKLAHEKLEELLARMDEPNSTNQPSSPTESGLVARMNEPDSTNQLNSATKSALQTIKITSDLHVSEPSWLKWDTTLPPIAEICFDDAKKPESNELLRNLLRSAAPHVQAVKAPDTETASDRTTQWAKDCELKLINITDLNNVHRRYLGENRAAAVLTMIFDAALEEEHWLLEAVRWSNALPPEALPSTSWDPKEELKTLKARLKVEIQAFIDWELKAEGEILRALKNTLADELFGNGKQTNLLPCKLEKSESANMPGKEDYVTQEPKFQGTDNPKSLAPPEIAAGALAPEGLAYPKFLHEDLQRLIPEDFKSVEALLSGQAHKDKESWKSAKENARMVFVAEKLKEARKGSRKEDQYQIPCEPKDFPAWKLIKKLLGSAATAPMKFLAPLLAIFAPLMILGISNPLKGMFKGLGEDTRIPDGFLWMFLLLLTLLIVVGLGVYSAVSRWREQKRFRRWVHGLFISVSVVIIFGFVGLWPGQKTNPLQTITAPQRFHALHENSLSQYLSNPDLIIYSCIEWFDQYDALLGKTRENKTKWQSEEFTPEKALAKVISVSTDVIDLARKKAAEGEKPILEAAQKEQGNTLSDKLKRLKATTEYKEKGPVVDALIVSLSTLASIPLDQADKLKSFSKAAKDWQANGVTLNQEVRAILLSDAWTNEVHLLQRVLRQRFAKQLAESLVLLQKDLITGNQFNVEGWSGLVEKSSAGEITVVPTLEVIASALRTEKINKLKKDFEVWIDTLKVDHRKKAFHKHAIQDLADAYSDESKLADVWPAIAEDIPNALLDRLWTVCQPEFKDEITNLGDDAKQVALLNATGRAADTGKTIPLVLSSISSPEKLNGFKALSFYYRAIRLSVNIQAGSDAANKIRGVYAESDKTEGEGAFAATSANRGKFWQFGGAIVQILLVIWLSFALFMWRIPVLASGIGLCALFATWSWAFVLAGLCASRGIKTIIEERKAIKDDHVAEKALPKWFKVTVWLLAAVLLLVVQHFGSPAGLVPTYAKIASVNDIAHVQQRLERKLESDPHIWEDSSSDMFQCSPLGMLLVERADVISSKDDDFVREPGPRMWRPVSATIMFTALLAALAWFARTAYRGLQKDHDAQYAIALQQAKAKEVARYERAYDAWMREWADNLTATAGSWTARLLRAVEIHLNAEHQSFSNREGARAAELKQKAEQAKLSEDHLKMLKKASGGILNASEKLKETIIKPLSQ